MKLDLARENLQQFRTACETLAQPDGGPWSGVHVNLNVDEGWIECQSSMPAELPLRLGGLIGASINNMRAALNYLARELVIANNETPTNLTEFPIFWDKDKFDGGAKSKMRGMSDAHKTIIKGLQPFRACPSDPKRSVLWLIHDFRIIDEHRMPLLCKPWLVHTKGSGLMPTEANARLVYVAPRGVLEDGAPIVRLEWDAGAVGDAQMSVEFGMTLDIAFKGEGISFTGDDGVTHEACPTGHFLDVCFDYMDNHLLPAFS